MTPPDLQTTDLEQLLPQVLTLLTTLLSLLAAIAVAQLRRYLGVKRGESEQRALIALVDGAIAYAEHRAAKRRSRGSVPAEGFEKLDWALSWLAREREPRGILDVERDRLLRLIESRLGDPRAPGGSEGRLLLDGAPTPRTGASRTSAASSDLDAPASLTEIPDE